MTERPDEPEVNEPEVDEPEQDEPGLVEDEVVEAEPPAVDDEAIEPDEDLVVEVPEEAPETDAEDEPDEAVEPEPEPEDVDGESDDEEPEGSEDASDEADVIVPPPGAIADDPEPDIDDPAGDADEEPEGDEPEEPRKKRRWPRRLGLFALLLIGGLYVAGYFLTGMRMPANATIGGVDVGGLSPTRAEATLDKALSPRVGEPVTLVHGEQEYVLKPDELDLTFDLHRSITQAGGQRSWDPRDMIALVCCGDHDHAPALDVNRTVLDETIAVIAEEIDVPVVEAEITFPDAKPEAREPKAGRVVAKPDAAQAVLDAYLVSTEPVEVPMVDVEPSVDSAGLARAMTEIAEPAVAEPVTLKVGDKDVSLPVTAYAPALVVRAEGSMMAPYIDPETLAEPLTNSTTGIGTKAVDARVDIKDGKPVVIPGKPGVGLHPEEMAESLLPVLTKVGDERAISIEAKAVDPLFTTEDAEALGIKEKMGEFSTFYPHAEYRNINQGRAAELIDGTLLKPGETFSFNAVVGERTRANGFTTGAVINGGRFREELGGGVSQVATTTYNAAFFSGLDDVEHHPHAFYIDRYPVGREATVYWGNLDLRFKNSTKHGVLVKAWVKRSTPGSRGEMHVEMWGVKEYTIEAGLSARRNFRSPQTRYDPAANCVPQGAIGGFDVDVYRVFKKGGKTVKTETDTAVYQAADRIICGEKPTPKPPATPPPAD